MPPGGLKILSLLKLLCLQPETLEIMTKFVGSMYNNQYTENLRNEDNRKEYEFVIGKLVSNTDSNKGTLVRMVVQQQTCLPEEKVTYIIS